MMMSGKEFLKSHVLSWRRKVNSEWEDVTSSGRVFQVFGPATGKARLPTVDRLTGGTRRRLVPVERSDRLPGRLHILHARAVQGTSVQCHKELLSVSKRKVPRCAVIILQLVHFDQDRQIGRSTQHTNQSMPANSSLNTA